MSTDAIVMLKDHKAIRKLFREFENVGKNAKARKGKLVDQILEALTVHTYIEHEGMYPMVRELVPDLGARATRSTSISRVRLAPRRSRKPFRAPQSRERCRPKPSVLGKGNRACGADCAGSAATVDRDDSCGYRDSHTSDLSNSVRNLERIWERSQHRVGFDVGVRGGWSSCAGCGW